MMSGALCTAHRDTISSVHAKNLVAASVPRLTLVLIAELCRVHFEQANHVCHDTGHSVGGSCAGPNISHLWTARLGRFTMDCAVACLLL